jgi:hypothetical protein
LTILSLASLGNPGSAKKKGRIPSGESLGIDFDFPTGVTLAFVLFPFSDIFLFPFLASSFEQREFFLI